MQQKVGRGIVLAGIIVAAGAGLGIISLRNQFKTTLFFLFTILLALSLLAIVAGLAISVVKVRQVDPKSISPESLLRQRLLLAGFMSGVVIGLVLLLALTPAWYGAGWIGLGLVLAVVIYQRRRTGLQNWHTYVWGLVFAYGMTFVIWACNVFTSR